MSGSELLAVVHEQAGIAFLAASSCHPSSCTWPALLPCLANKLLLNLTLPALLALTAIV